MSVLSVSIPLIQTERLILRAPRMDDLPAMIAFHGSDRARYVGGIQQPWQVWSMLTASLGHWLMRGFGWWMIEDKETGERAGRVGIGYHIDWPEPELGWHIYDGYEGRGLASEAALAARHHGYHVMGLGPLISLIDLDNQRSHNLAQRLGAVPETQTVIRGADCMIYRHPKETA